MEKFLKEKRLLAKLTQSEAAKRLDVTEATVQNWENGRSKPDFTNLKIISKVYKIPVDELTFEVSKIISGLKNLKPQNELADKKHLFPKGIDWSILGLELSKTEINVLFAINIANTLSADPLCAVSNQFNDMVILNKAINKLFKFNLLEETHESHSDSHAFGSVYWCKVSDRGKFIMDIISKIYPIDYFNLMDHLTAKEAFNLISRSKAKDAIDAILGFSNYVKSKNLKGDIYDLDNYVVTFLQRNNKPYIWHNRSELIDYLKEESLFFVKDVESTDEEYLNKKAAYMKKLQFYEKHKDEMELIEPRFSEVFHRDAVFLTDKAKEIVKILT